MQNLGICRHYHSDMSREYLEDAYTSFAEEEGNCLILNATAGAGEGLDVAGIDGVIIYGIVGDISTKSQWMAVLDPDRPFSDVALTKKNPTKQERTGRASIHLATSPRCERVLKAEYYQDSSPDGRWCCDSDDHIGNTFAIDKLFLGPVYKEEPAPLPAKRRRTNYRKPKDRPELERQLLQWRSEVHSRFTLRSIRPPTFILDDAAINKLTMAPASSLNSAEDVVGLLEQSPEWEYMWAAGVLDVVSKYKPEEDGNSDEELTGSKRRKP
ncbi:hypothetical protein B0H14DRAFT_3778811 [Mycena olivaceomarginata]|nr:hypothetical protein B0H14DRAFT_3778811 [Mycena olivaceomarginata]